MAEDLKKKIHGFFEWYEDIYGKNYYIPKENVVNVNPSPVENGNKLTKLREFRKEIEHCTKCRLYKSRKNFVFGTGNGNAEIMFIGEAPGREEDLQGEPFVGQAGRVLNKMLNQIHLKRTDVYIANILKSRPPNNRDPLPDEVKQCIPYLHQQIEIIKPKLLVALGRIAAQNLLNTQDSLSKLRSKIWNYKDIPLIVTYHPAAILRNASLENATLEDFYFISQSAKNL